jgi:hypothetical protein
MTDWKLTVKPVPCEQFRQAGHDAVLASVDPGAQQRANAAVALAEQLVFQVSSGQGDTKYGATISRHRGAKGDERLSVVITAKPVPA